MRTGVKEKFLREIDAVLEHQKVSLTRNSPTSRSVSVTSRFLMNDRLASADDKGVRAWSSSTAAAVVSATDLAS